MLPRAVNTKQTSLSNCSSADNLFFFAGGCGGMSGWVDENEAFLFRDDIEVNVVYIKRATEDERYRTSEGWNDQPDGSGFRRCYPGQ